MIINQGNLWAAFIGFRLLYQNGFTRAPVTFERIAMTVPSNTKENKYPWLGLNTKFRQWVGERIFQSLVIHDYSLKNIRYEDSIAIPRDDFEDDTIGVFTPVLEQLGWDAKCHPDILVYNLLKAGLTTPCYDGQPFFSAQHPSWDANGNATQVANIDSGGSGPYWYLMVVDRPVKPLIFQKRKDYTFAALVKDTDPNVFERNEFRYGVDARVNVGFGLWQMAYASNQPLDPTHYGNARAAIRSYHNESGDAMDLNPSLLLVPPALEGAANTITKADIIDATSNVWKGTAETLCTNRLA
jgi:phage major head subunit gpT-like protein